MRRNVRLERQIDALVKSLPVKHEAARKLMKRRLSDRELRRKVDKMVSAALL